MKQAFIFLLSLLLFCIVFPSRIVMADDSSMSATVFPTTVANYTLPYPGILPDNPLYVLKTLRDRIVTFFISDPLKKGSFYLLESDKRLEATWYLLKENNHNEDLALSTVSKSTNYLSLAVSQVTIAHQSGEDTSDLVKRIQDATTTHMTVIKDMQQFPGLKKGAAFAKEQQRLEAIVKEVSGISPKQ